MNSSLRVFVGFDPAEVRAYDVAVNSMIRRASIPIDVIPLRADRLFNYGLLRRPIDTRNGRKYDIYSNAPAATEFAISRFLVPVLAQTGPALFIDCDMVVFADLAELLELYDHGSAVQVVKHFHVPRAATKMGGHAQTSYPRKNWSSVMLWNCDHPAHGRLSLDAINHRPGRDLHSFFWLADDEIGDLPCGWNWLVDEQPQPDELKIAHFTNGGPWIDSWASKPSDALWLTEEKQSCK